MISEMNALSLGGTLILNMASAMGDIECDGRGSGRETDCKVAD